MKKVSSIGALLVFLLTTSFTIGVSVNDNTLKVDLQNSKATWIGKKFTGEHTGNVRFSNGQFQVANGKLKGGSFELNLNSITVTDITDASSNAKLVGHLKGDDFFGVAKHPTASFAIVSANHINGDDYNIKGKLTIKGITQDIEFPANVKLSKDKVQARAKITVNRTKFDIKYGSKSFFDNLGDKFIYDDFELEVDLVASNVAAASKSK
jgi:polyisoprenoid-binding protein YceI